jgi:outer membrane receptor protein involved in Fe transport
MNSSHVSSRFAALSRSAKFTSLLLAGAVSFSGLLAPLAAAQDVQDMDLDSLLELSLESLFAVKIITASKVVESAMLAPSTAYVITAEHIQRLGLRDLKDVLTLVPGVDTVDPHFFLEGGQRGFMGTFSQTLILINGREMNNLIAGETFIAHQFRTHNVKQVEVINGPGSALYGANAVAGVINVITKTSDDLDGFEVSSMVGPHNTLETAVSFGSESRGLKVWGSYAYYQTDGEDFSRYLSDTAKASPMAENNAYRRLPSEYGYENEARAIPITMHAEYAGFYVGMNYYQNVMGRGTSGIQWDYTQGEDYRELMMGYAGYNRKNLFDGKMDLSLEYRYYEERFWGNHTEGEGPLENPYDGTFKTDGITDVDIGAYRGFYSNKRSEGSTKHVAKYENTLRLGEDNVLVAGIDYELADVVGANWSRLDKPHPSIGTDQRRDAFNNWKWAVYVQDQQKLFGDRLILTAGLRYDDHERYGGTWNPRGGIVYRPVEATVFKLLYGESFREPTVFELLSDTNIKPMTMQTYEFAWQQFFGKHVKNSVVGFYNTAKDMIVSDATELGGISNKGELEASGFENELSVNYGPFTGFANYTYTVSHLDDPTEGRYRVLDIPRHKANLGLMVDLPADLSLGLVSRYRSEVDTEYYGERVEIDDFITMDATLSMMKIPGMRADAHIDLIVKNVFDATYYDPEPRSPSVVMHPQEGQGLFVRLVMKM